MPETVHVERRRAPRVPHSGRVQIFSNGAAIEAQLVDVSATGFRAQYGGCELHPGAPVTFQRADASGAARVMWTQVLGGRYQSGFLLL